MLSSKFRRAVCAALSAVLVLSLVGCQMEKRTSKADGESGQAASVQTASEQAEKPRERGERVPAPETIRGVTLSSGVGDEYPSSALLSKDELRAEAEALAAWAVTNSFNSMFYEVTPGGAAIYPSAVLPHSSSFAFSSGNIDPPDPLAFLISAAAEQNVAVFAVISPYEASDDTGEDSLSVYDPASTVMSNGETFYRPSSALVHNRALAAAAEIAKKYNIAGLIVGRTDDSPINDYQGFYTYLSALVSDMADAAAIAAGEQKPLQMGLLLSSEAEPGKNRSAFIDSACYSSVDFIAPEVHGSTSGSPSPYSKELGEYVALATQNKKVTYPVLPADSFSPKDCQSALMLCNELGLSGGVLSGYRALLGESAGVIPAAIPLMYVEGEIIPEEPLTVPTGFRITRPLDGNRLTIPTDWERYYITGISDPAVPLYLDDELVPRTSESGTFGIVVEPEIGENAYEFWQDSNSIIVTIVRSEPDTVSHISTISTYAKGAGTVFQPYGDQMVNSKLPMLFQCIAPSGGIVTATLGGESYELKQTAETEDDGVPVVFKKEVKIPEGDPESVSSIGFVTYTLDFEDKTSEVQAPGEVFLVGRNRAPLCRVEAGIGTVLNPSMADGDFMTTLKPGSLIEVVDQTTNYFKTSFGGFIQKVETSVVTDLPSLENTVSSLELKAAENGDERLVLHGDRQPSFVVENAENGDFTVNIIGTSGVASGPLAVQSRFFSSMQAENKNGSLRLSFSAGEREYFGYNINYDGNDTVLSFYERPSISPQPARPLLGLTIVVDPGHGASDPGAAGVAGELGPVEKDANLYVSQITAKLLEGYGANVVMTRDNDSDFLTIDERVDFTERHDADFFISMHHNSLDERIDGNEREGVWVYYYNDISKDIADMFVKDLSAATGRRLMGSENGWYVVCRNTLAPSVLLELGFMPNPAEYEDICDEGNMLDIARSVCDTVSRYIASLNE